MTKLLNKIFRDTNGKLTIVQFPNIPLFGFIVAEILAYLIGAGKLHRSFADLSTAFLFSWAYLEIRYGDAIFRRVFGSVVMAGILVMFFMRPFNG